MMNLFIDNLKEFDIQEEEPKDNDKEDSKYINIVNENYKEYNSDINKIKKLA